jgi:hypothetical protein
MFERLFSKSTAIREPFFRMTLPGKWSSWFDQANERWNFNTESEQVTVSLMGVAPGMSSDERLELLKELVRVRREAELAVATGVRLGQVVYASAGATHLARYEASGPEPDRLSTCLLMVNTSVIGTFFYEAAGLAEAEFQSRGRSAFNSIQLAEARGG